MLDYVTALVILAAAALTVAGALVAAWMRDRAADSLLFWASGFCATAIGLGLVAAGPGFPAYISLGLTNLLLLLAFAGWIWGAQRLNGRPLGPEALLPAAVWLASVAVPDLRETFYLRYAVLNGGSAIGYFLLGLSLRPGRARAPDGQPAGSSRGPISLLLLISAAWSLVIAAAGLLLRPEVLGAFQLAWLDGIVEVLILLVIVIYGARLVRERSEARLHALADSDPLTGVLNRRGLNARLEGLLARDPGAGLALLMFDLDHFKRVNDSFGHDAGDIVLQVFCRRAEAQLRPDDLFGRLGGEEFAAVLRVHDPGQAREVAERIRSAVADAPVDLAGRSVPVTVSVGVALLPPGSTGGVPSFEPADRALYAAKAAGRNRVELADALPGPGGPAADSLPTGGQPAGRAS